MNWKRFLLSALLLAACVTPGRTAEALFNLLPNPPGTIRLGSESDNSGSNASGYFGSNNYHWAPGFRTAASATHIYIAGSAYRTVPAYLFGVFMGYRDVRDGFITKMDSRGLVVGSWSMNSLTGFQLYWQINDIATYGNSIYVCGDLDDGRSYVAKLTDTGSGPVINDYTIISPQSGPNVTVATSSANSIAVSLVGGVPKVVVAGEITGETMYVGERQRTFSAIVFQNLVLRCKNGAETYSDAWVLRLDDSLHCQFGTTLGHQWSDDAASAVTADNTGAIFLALKLEDPDRSSGSVLSNLDDNRKVVTDTNPAGSVIPNGGIFNDYDYWGGRNSHSLLLRLDPDYAADDASGNAVQSLVTSYFETCMVQSEEEGSHSRITDLAYSGGSLYVAGEWKKILRPVAHLQSAAPGSDSPLSISNVSAYSWDIWVAKLNPASLQHSSWRLFQSAGDDYVNELTVTGSEVYLAGLAGSTLSHRSTLTRTGTGTTLSPESSSPHLFWEKMDTGLTPAWHVIPYVGGTSSIPTVQRISGIGVLGTTVVPVGAWDGGNLSMGSSTNVKTLADPASQAGFAVTMNADGTFKEGLKLDIKSTYGNPLPARGTTTVISGDTVSASVQPVVYEDAAGNVIASTDSDAVNQNAVTRRVCTGYQFKNSTVNGTINAVSFVVTADMELTFNWRTEHAVEIESALAGSGGLTSPAAGNPEPAVQKHWIPENDQFTAFIDGAATDIAQPGVRWMSTGYVASGCVSDATGTTSGNPVSWPVYQPRQQTPKITVGRPGRIQWLWEKQYSVRVSTNSSVAASAPSLIAPPRFIRADSATGFPANWLPIHPPEAANDGLGNKYLNLAKFNTGVIFNYASGLAANRLRLIIAEDMPDRDPTTFIVEGRNGSGAWVSIAGSTAIPSSGRGASVEFPLNNTVVYTGYRITFPTIANSNTDSMQIQEISLGTAGNSTGTGEFWAPVGASITVSSPASVSSGISTLTLKGYTNGIGSISPFDQRGVSTKTFTLNEASSITWDYARAIYPETVIVGRPIAFTGVTGVDATNANRSKAPLSGNVQVAPSGSSFTDMMTWDAVAQRALVLRPGKFTVEFENTAAANDPAQNVIVEVTAVWGVPDYPHILETPPVDLDPSDADSLKFLSLSYSEGGGKVRGTAFSTPEPGRSVLLFSTRTGGIATGNLAQEPLAVKVVNTLPWAASAQAYGNWAAPATIGQALSSADHSAAVGHNGYVLSALAPVNAAAHNRETAEGPIFPVNENFPDTGRWSSGNDPAQTRLLAGRIVEFDSADDLLLDPATVKVAVALNGDTNRTVKGVLFQTDLAAPGLNGRSFDTLYGDSQIIPVENLFNAAASATFVQSGSIAYDNNFIPAIPGLTSPETFSVLWEGWLDVARDGTGAYTFGTSSDDGSVIYLDLNGDGDFADAGEMIVDNRGLHGALERTATVNLPMNSVRIAIAFFEDGGGEFMEARFKKGSALSYSALDVISGSSGHFKRTNPYAAGGAATANGVTVTTSAAAVISNWAAPALTGTSAAELSEIMRDFRYSNAPNAVDVTVSGLAPGQIYNIQLLTNETSAWDRRFDVSVNNTLAVDNYTSSGHSAGRRWRPDNSYAWTAEYVAPADGILRIKLAQNIGGNPALPFDGNPILNAVIVHTATAVQGAGSPIVDEPGSLAVAWYQQRDGINWPWKAVRYIPQWPASPGRIVTASRLGSEGLTSSGVTNPAGWITWSGVLNASSPRWNRPAPDKLSVRTEATRYLAVPASSAGPNFPLWLIGSPSVPTEVFIYEGTVDPGRPLQNLRYTATLDGNWNYAFSLPAATLYTIVFSLTGPYTGDAGVNFDIQGGGIVYTLPQIYSAPAFSDPVIYHQPVADALGYNPNEEHSLIAPSFLDPTRSAAFALRADLNRTALNADFTSKPYTLVQYTDKTDAANPVVKMAVYSIADEDSSITDPRLPAFNQKYTYFYQGEAGQRLLPPYPLDVVIGPSTWPEETNAENVDGRVAYHEDKKHNAWILSGDTDVAEDIRAELYYPIRADFWHPTLETGDVMPLGHLPAASPVRDIFYNTIWPANVAQLKAGETLTFSGGEYATDHNSDSPQPKGLPGAVAWQCGKLLFDSANATMSPIQTGSNYMARLIPALSKREVPLAFTSLPDELKPASGNVIVEGLIWRFKKLPASLQKRCYYDSSSQKLGFRGYLNDHTLGDGDLLAAPGAQTILQPNVITDADSALIAGLSSAGAWQSSVTALSNLTRSPLGGTATGTLALGLEPVSGGSLPATLFGPGLAVITNPDIQKSTTAASLPDGYITIAENDDESLGDAPVAIHVIKVIRQKYRGSIAVLRPENVFDEKLTLRHTADFGGDVSDLFFEWYYKEEDGRDLNPPGVTLPTAGKPTGADWTVFGSGVGLNEIQISGASPATLTDNVFYVRYRHKDDAANWSAWGGAANSREPNASSPSAPVDIAYVAQLAPGWIKRVTDAVNAFDARIRDFRNNNAPATYTSMIQQAGQRWEGPVAFNPQKDAIENVGLIELYQTVLDRGKDLSINLSPGTDGVNTALLNAANRIAGLYTMLGNEAMADAADPTVGYSTVGGQFGNVAPVIHSFQNQTGNLLQEEIALLRGRGEVGARPAYNRLLWNFTNGSGEAAYVLNYGITDLNSDGFLSDADARRLYPQGHGDAWGHYTMAMKGYYDLATLNNFTWSSRSEKYLIDGIVLDVDYLDERAFAKTAAARAQCGAQLVDLVYRQAYTENPSGQWQGYRDTNTDRAWGVFETAQRTGTAALCDWLTANALLKGEETDPAKTGIRKVDRTTVGELKLIAAKAAAIQAKLDSADRGMNPAGLDPDVVPFDIDPVLTDRTNPNAATHFEQVYSRAVGTNKNALMAFNHASEEGLLVRRTAASTEELRKQAQDQDLAYRNKLIEYFGTPYEGMIGGGKAYPEGYSGPDLYLFLYVDQVSAGGDLLPELDGDIVPTTIVPGLRNLATDTNPFLAGGTGVDGLLKDTVSNYFPADVALPISAGEPVTLNLPRRASGYALVAPADWGQRRSPGAIQAAIQQLVQAEWKLRMAVDAYEGTSDDFKLLLRKFEVKSGISAEKIRLAAYAEDRQDLWHNVATGMFAATTVIEHAQESMAIGTEWASEALPKVVGLANDAASPARGVIHGIHFTADLISRLMETPFQITQYRAELEAEEAMVEMDQALLTEDLKSELLDILAEIQQLANDEGDLRMAVIDALESMRAASDRVRTVTQEGLAIIEERTVFNQRVAATTTQQRYEDYTFRVTHTEALRKYQSSFDLAARSAYLAGKAYAYELNLPDNHAANATPLLAEMLRTRTLGEWDGTSPVIGQGGLAEQLAILKTNFDTLKGQLGFNNPATEVNSFSVRAELGRIGLSARVNADWRTKLETWRVPDLWNFQYQNSGVNYGYVFRRYCRPFAPEAAGAQPALVIPFDSSIAAGKNWFGKTLAGGDSSFNASNFSTKIRSAGIRFDGYNNTAMSQTPQVYLVPVGMDRMFLPDSTLLADRSWNVVDQRIPVPLPISPSNLADPDWQPFTGSASGFFEEIRKFSSFRAYHDAGGYSPSEMLSTGRLVGRSVWNTQWVLIIPSATLLNDPANPSAGIDTLIYGAPLPGYTQGTAGTTNRDLIGARDIRILLQTYSISGN